MCGIFGVYNIESKNKFERQRIYKAASKMKHRGPDFLGIEIFGDYAALAHLRLSIIDLSPASNQPFEWAGRYYITFNGEIFNYIELKRELLAEGYSFRTHSDTEVLVASYHHWGNDCVNHFNGMWAFAIYDSKENTLFCSRDRFGIKPFNYAVVNGQFIFSSEIKSILEYFPEERVPNYNVIANFCRNSIGAQISETWFQNIFRLEPAHNLTITIRGLKKERYWDYPKRVDRKLNFDAATKIYKKIFLDAVNLRMRSDVPVGFTLSSGLDSTSIVSILKGKLTGNNRTYTAAFPKNQFVKSEKQNYKDDIEINESKLVKRLAQELGLNSKIVEVNFDKYIAQLSKIIYHLESGHGSPAIFPLNSIHKIASEDIKVVLEGQGADELLAGYINNVESVYLLELLKHLKLGTAAKEFNYYRQVYSLKSLVMLFVRHLNKGWIQKVYYNLSGINAFYSGKIKYYFHIKDFPIAPKGFDNPINSHLFKAHTGGLVNLLHYGDAISMAHSIESRLPFMDYHLVEFSFKLPSEFKVRNGFGKYVHRKAMEGIVPDSVLSERIKHGFSTPLFHIFSKEGEDSAAGILLSNKCLSRGLFSEKAIRKALDKQRSGTKDFSRYLYRMLNVELWFRNFIDRPSIINDNNC